MVAHGVRRCGAEINQTRTTCVTLETAVFHFSRDELFWPVTACQSGVQQNGVPGPRNAAVCFSGLIADYINGTAKKQYHQIAFLPFFNHGDMTQLYAT